jgi:hypothetical protein
MSIIYLMRHAEKPDKGHRGVDEKGAPDDASLIPRGWQRAGALALFFGQQAGVLLPDRIYASAAAKKEIAPGEKVGSHSKRPIETVSPLAARHKLEIIDKFAKGEEADLAEELRQFTGTALVCWQHEAIPDVSFHLAGVLSGVPKAWPDDRFDVIWRFSRKGDGPWTFDQICPQLLGGDSKESIN